MNSVMKRVNKGNLKLQTTKMIAEKMIHIGEDKAITKRKLFYTLFKESYDDNNLKHYVMWEFAKKAMHLLRTKTKCFVISKRDDVFKFFVPKTDDENWYYIKAMKAMKARSRKAIREEWYREEWTLPNTKRRKIQ